MEIYRGQIYYADLADGVGSEQGGLRPVLVLQNNKGNLHAPTTIIAPLTCSSSKHSLPTHICTKATGRPSTILLEQIRVIDKARIRGYVAELESATMGKIDAALKISLGI